MQKSIVLRLAILNQCLLQLGKNDKSDAEAIMAYPPLERKEQKATNEAKRFESCASFQRRFSCSFCTADGSRVFYCFQSSFGE